MGILWNTPGRRRGDRRRSTFAAVLIVLAALLALATTVQAGNKVTICHGAGREGTTKFVTLTLSENAVYKEQGGHFYEDGTPQAGHEQDYFGPCEEATPSPTPTVNTPTPTPTEVSTPTPEATYTPKATSTDTPRATPTPSESTASTPAPEIPDTAMCSVERGTCPTEGTDSPLSVALGLLTIWLVLVIIAKGLDSFLGGTKKEL